MKAEAKVSLCLGESTLHVLRALEAEASQPVQPAKGHVQVAIIQIITVASNLAFQRAVGRFVDRHMRLSLFLGRATFMTWPLVYGIATNVYQIYAAYLFFGFGGSISNIAYFAYVVDNAEDRRKAIGYLNLVNALGAATGAELSSAMLAYAGNYGEELIRRMLIGAAFARLGSSFLFLL